MEINEDTVNCKDMLLTPYLSSQLHLHVGREMRCDSTIKKMKKHQSILSKTNYIISSHPVWRIQTENKDEDLK